MVGKILAEREKRAVVDKALAGVVLFEQLNVRGVGEALGADGEVEGALEGAEFAVDGGVGG